MIVSECGRLAEEAVGCRGRQKVAGSNAGDIACAGRSKFFCSRGGQTSIFKSLAATG